MICRGVQFSIYTVFGTFDTYMLLLFRLQEESVIFDMTFISDRNASILSIYLTITDIAFFAGSVCNEFDILSHIKDLYLWFCYSGNVIPAFFWTVNHIGVVSFLYMHEYFLSGREC